MRQLTISEFRAELIAQGVRDHANFAFRCPMCKTIQSARDIMAATGKTFDWSERYLAFSCIGRFTNAGPQKANARAGRGCDWTLGGLIRIHELEVIDGDGLAHPRFAIASAQEALMHQEALDAPRRPQAGGAYA